MMASPALDQSDRSSVDADLGWSVVKSQPSRLATIVERKSSYENKCLDYNILLALGYILLLDLMLCCFNLDYRMYFAMTVFPEFFAYPESGTSVFLLQVKLFQIYFASSFVDVAQLALV